MKRVLVLLLTTLAIGCSHAPVLVTVKANGVAPPIVLSSTPPPSSTVLRAFVLGDAGREGSIRQTVDAAMRVRLALRRVKTVVLMPGDLFHPTGLGTDCARARERVEAEYVSKFPGVQFYSVAGNHDHGEIANEARPKLAHRVAYFDCRYHDLLEDETGWPASCACVKDWSYLTGPGLAGWANLGPVALVGYDSQQALVDARDVAGAFANALAAAPKGEPVLVMGHHPFVSFGPHGAGQVRTDGDLKSRAYQAYLTAVEPIVEKNAPRIALLLFGHDHMMEFVPGHPSELISGAGAKMTHLFAKPPAPDFAVDRTPGFAELDIAQDGSMDVTVFSREPPRTFHIPPR